ncbi:MAG: hypothetical protein Tp1124SUR272871_46 [Prokaryotic dsDNA virus sp.]|jgi:hypothetical protein|nr:MAG: hypothetical protein Tp1124SUR272871_46 [Prokaryotic dsDNA virus sp.]|tara:strand:+ start:20217 stop:20807 length:591 start_codon:yes stop_codon:yes gene_type:complete
MATTSKIDIAQQAMVLVGLQPLTSFDDQTDEALSANLLYETVVRDCLSQHTWNFATGQKVLNRLADTPVDIWDAAYQLPTDVEPLIIQTITNDDITIQYDRYEDKIYTLDAEVSENDTLVATYQFRADEDDWPPYFQMYVVYRLASTFALSIIRKGDIAQSLSQLAEQQFTRAKTRDSQAVTTNKIKLNRFANIRK